MLVRITLLRSACIALVMLNLMGRWCDVACCSPGTACADGCSTEGMCCEVEASDIQLVDSGSDSDPAGETDGDQSKTACSAVCCAKILVVELSPIVHGDCNPQRWLPAVADDAPELISCSGIFHPPRA